MFLDEKMKRAGLEENEALERPFPYGKYQGLAMEKCPLILLKSLGRKNLRDNMPLDERRDILAARYASVSKKNRKTVRATLSTFPMTCNDCGHQSQINNLRLNRKARIACVKCGGTMSSIC